MNTLIVVDSDPLSAQRVLNMVQLMARFGTVTVAEIRPTGLTSIEISNNFNFERIIIPRKTHNRHWNYSFLDKKLNSILIRCRTLLSARSYLFHEFSSISNIDTNLLREKLNLKDIDVVIVHHIWNVPFVYKLFKKTNAKIICNLHEYYPEEHSENSIWVRQSSGYVRYLCDKYIKRMHFCFSVCDSITNKYKEIFGGRYILFRNVKEYFDLKPSCIEENFYHLVHHGIANRSRKIENFIQAVDNSSGRFRLHLFLTSSRSDPSYYSMLEEQAAASRYTEFHAPVPTSEIPAHINKYDIALSIVPNANFNEICMLPNKIFESIQARLMMVVGPSHEMRSLVEGYNVGISLPETSAECLAETLATINKGTIAEFKQRSHLAANELCTEREIQRTITMLSEVGIHAD